MNTIKVEHTRKIKLSQYTPNLIGLQLVTDAELVLVEEKGLFDFRKPNEGGNQLKDYHLKLQGLYFKPILISCTEKIEVGDWYLTPSGNIVQSKGEPNFEVVSGWYKILALPEHFSPKHLQNIVEGRWKEGKYLVECEKYCAYRKDGFPFILQSDGRKGFHAHDEHGWESLDEKDAIKFDCRIKLNPHITIYPSLEEKMYTREEVWVLLDKVSDGFLMKGWSYMSMKNWFAKNVK